MGQIINCVKLQDYEVRVGVKVSVRVRIFISAGALIIEFSSVWPALLIASTAFICTYGIVIVL